MIVKSVLYCVLIKKVTVIQWNKIIVIMKSIEHACFDKRKATVIRWNKTSNEIIVIMNNAIKYDPKP